MIDATLLIVDDDRDILETARMFLKGEFSQVLLEQDPSCILSTITSQSIDLIMLDMNFRRGVNDGVEGFYWLERILEVDPEAVVVLITAYGEVDLAVNAMKKGAIDFVLKPWKNQKLLATLLSALNLRKSKLEVKKLRQVNRDISSQWRTDMGDFIGDSPQIQRVKELVAKVAPTDANILITGENGTGKEVVARALHQQSNRNENAFIRVDMGTIPESLFESEMFGHMKGSFTDAQKDKAGRFELADKGTLFLDEMTNMSLSMQAKLLTVIQNRTIRRVGANKEMHVDIRLISATNQLLDPLVQENKFRQDLLYRINTVEIALPPLRDRTGDIYQLAEFFLQVYRRKYQKPDLKLSEKSLVKLENYKWPGNVRELQHCIERSVILAEKSEIEATDILIETVSLASGPPKTLEENEKQFLLKSLEENDWNISQTARALGLTRTAMYRRMNKHNL